jgi:hypothetical protein
MRKDALAAQHGAPPLQRAASSRRTAAELHQDEHLLRLFLFARLEV